MSKNNIELIKFAKTKIGTPYVYGCKGEKLTSEKFKMLRRMYPSIIPARDSSKIGSICVDCSGLISWYTGILRGSSEYKDVAEKVYPISTIKSAQEGVAVWRQGHIGVYIGSGYIIEARGTNYGVVKTKVNDRNFTNWFQIKDIEYIDNIDKEKEISIVDFLKDKKMDSSLENRKLLAKIFGIKNYKGTASQNITLLEKCIERYD